MLSNIYILGLISVVSWLLFLFSSFKLRQTRGKQFVNEFSTDVGGGSFTDTLVHPLKKMMWATSATVFFFVAIGFSLAIVDVLEKKQVKEQNISGAKMPVEPKAAERLPEKNIQNNNIKIPESSPKVVDSAEDGAVVQSDKSQDGASLSDEEIRKLEAEKGYSGDDPIIRKRLGLPPRN